MDAGDRATHGAVAEEPVAESEKLHQSKRTLLDQISLRKTKMAILTGDRRNTIKISNDQLLCSLAILLIMPAMCQFKLFLA
jgi:hypothetical protein